MKVSDPAEDFILSLHLHPSACVNKLHMKEIFAKTTLAASVTNTMFELCSDVIKGWQSLLQGIHAGDGPLYNTLSPVENKNDLELDFKDFFSSRILVVQTLYMVNQTDATLASFSVWKN